MPGTGQTFTIQVTNQSGSSRNFYLFQEKPELPSVDTGKVFTNAYGVASGIEVDATATFEMNHNYYAIYGTSTKKIQNGVTISTVAPKTVSLGASKTVKDASCWGVTAPDHLHPKWTDETKITAVNGFRISTDSSWQDGVSTNIFVGVGSDDPTGGSKKVPITTVIGDPSVDYTFTIKKVYYLAVGNFQQGELVDVSEAGKFYKIDATGDPEPLKKYRFLKNGKFEPDT